MLASTEYDNEPFLKWIVNVSATADPIPNIFSISYQDYEDTCAPAFMDRLNTGAVTHRLLLQSSSEFCNSILPHSSPL